MTAGRDKLFRRLPLDEYFRQSNTIAGAALEAKDAKFSKILQDHHVHLAALIAKSQGIWKEEFLREVADYCDSRPGSTSTSRRMALFSVSHRKGPGNEPEAR